MKKHSFCAPTLPSGQCMECVRENLEAENASLKLQVSELQKLLEKAVRLLSVCSFDHPLDLADLDAVNNYADKPKDNAAGAQYRSGPLGPGAPVAEKRIDEPCEHTWLGGVMICSKCKKVEPRYS